MKHLLTCNLIKHFIYKVSEREGDWGELEEVGCEIKHFIYKVSGKEGAGGVYRVVMIKLQGIIACQKSD